MKELATPELLRQLLWYNPFNGQIKWKVSPGPRAPVGSEAGSLTGNGYRAIVVNGKRYRAHMIAWAMFKGKWPETMLDHRDGNGLNNAIANLRLSSNAENQQNKAVSVKSRSGITGVSWNSEQGGWSATIKVNGKNRRLGVYATKEAAAKRYAEEKRRLHTFHPEVVTRPSKAREAALSGA